MARLLTSTQAVLYLQKVSVPVVAVEEAVLLTPFMDIQV